MVDFEPSQQRRKVNKALSVKAQFTDGGEFPLWLWFPVIVFALTTLDYMALFFDETFAETFFLGDESVPLLAGVVFASLWGAITAGLYFGRRWAIYTGIVALVLEFGFYYFIASGGVMSVADANAAGYESQFMFTRVPLFTWQGEVAIFGGGDPIPSGMLYIVRSIFFLLMLIACWFSTE